MDKALVEEGAQLCGAFCLIAEESSGDEEEIDQHVQRDRCKGAGVPARRSILQAEKSVG